MHTYISSIGTATPPYRMSQRDTADFMANILKLNSSEARKLRVLYRATAIDYRYTVLEDYTLKEKLKFFPNDDAPFPTTAERMKIYQENATKLSIAAVRDCWKNIQVPLTEVTHLITVSCTGMYAPGLDLELVEQLGLSFQTERTCINFMGCYAAFNALKVGDAICKSTPNAKVLIVDLELCTIHFQNSKLDDDLIANAIFADGAAAVFLESTPSKGISLRLDGFFCDLAPDGKDEMAWYIKDYGFEMKLSTYVPEILKGNAKNLIMNLLDRVNLDISEVHHLAIHPGGRRILEVIEEALQFSREKNKAAYEVLRNFGNMSSVTVLFVLKHLLNQINSEHQHQNILSLAFGPGLTMESALFNIQVI